MMTLSEAARIVGGTMSGNDAAFTSVGTDSRTIGAGGLFVAIPGKRVDGHTFLSHAATAGAVGAIVSDRTSAERLNGEPGLPLVGVPDTTLALGRLGKDWRSRFDIPVAAVTGSNGKTTVTAMTASIFRQWGRCLSPQKSFNNAWGVPLTLLRLTGRHRFAVIEMGASHPGEIEYLARLAGPTIALVNNAAPAHLEGLGSIAQIAQEKAGIFAGLPASGVAVLNADDRFHDQWAAMLNASRPDITIVRFAIAAEAEVSACNVKSAVCASRFDLQVRGRSIAVNLPLPGRHNIMNALAAAAVCFAAGAGFGQIKDGLETVSAVTGRLDIRPGLGGATVIDDSYNANPESMRAAIHVLRQYRGKKVLALGGMAELGESSPQLHEEVGAYARTQGIDHLYCYARDGNDHARFYAERFGGNAGIFYSMEELQQAVKRTLDADAVILIKGSRSSRMERLVHEVVAAHPNRLPREGECLC